MANDTLKGDRVIRGVSPTGFERNIATDESGNLISVVSPSTSAGNTPVNLVQISSAAISVSSAGVQRVSIADGATGNSFKEATVANVSALSGAGSQLASRPGDWSVTYASTALASLASAVKAAGGAGVRHVCTGILAVLTPNTLTANPGGFHLYLRDGASGAGTLLSDVLVNISTSANTPIIIPWSGLNIVGSSSTAMTLEFSGGQTGCYESVTLTGYDVS